MNRFHYFELKIPSAWAATASKSTFLIPATESLRESKEEFLDDPFPSDGESSLFDDDLGSVIVVVTSGDGT